eukprot:scaffold1120_cov57-Phaeocystis_antarctica.AAC.2
MSAGPPASTASSSGRSQPRMPRWSISRKGTQDGLGNNADATSVHTGEGKKLWSVSTGGITSSRSRNTPSDPKNA